MSRIFNTGSASTLEAEISDLFNIDVSVVVTDPSAEPERIHTSEERAIATAGQKRRKEFCAGRLAARRAMQQMGVDPVPVPSDADRAPVWPANLAGSISHSDKICTAVLAESRDAPAIGIDVEDASPIEEELIPEICTRLERAWLSSQPEGERGFLARLLFSAKECAYKCQFAISREQLDFKDLEITLDLETGQFEATFLRDAIEFRNGDRLYGRYSVTGGHIITAMTAHRPQATRDIARRVSFW